MKIETKQFGGFKNFHDMLKRFKPFIYPDDSRFNLNGILFEFHAEFTRLVATDGHKLIIENVDMLNDTVGKVIISKIGIEYFINLETDYTIEIKERYIAIDDSSYKFIIDATFPDYEKVILQGEAIMSFKTTKKEFAGIIKSGEANLLDRYKKLDAYKSLQEEFREKGKFENDALLKKHTYKNLATCNFFFKEDTEPYLHCVSIDGDLRSLKTGIKEKAFDFNAKHIKDAVAASNIENIDFCIVEKGKGDVVCVMKGNKQTIVLMPLFF